MRGRGGLLAWPLAQDMENRRLGSCTEAVLAGTPVKGRGALGAHVSGHQPGLARGARSGGPPRVCEVGLLDPFT